MINNILLVIALIMLGATLENRLGVSYHSTLELQNMIRDCELKHAGTCRLKAIPYNEK